EDLGNGNGSAAKEARFLPVGVVFRVQHFDKALDLRLIRVVVFVEGAYVLKDIGHLVDRVVAALGSGSVAGNSFYVHTDLHTSALSSVDAAVCGFGGDNELRTDLVLVDNVLPAETVAVFF